MATSAARKVFLVNTGCFNPPTIMHLRMFGNQGRNWHDNEALMTRVLDIGKDCLEAAKQPGFKVLGGILSPTHDGYGKKVFSINRQTHTTRLIDYSFIGPTPVVPPASDVPPGPVRPPVRHPQPLGVPAAELVQDQARPRGLPEAAQGMGVG